MNYFCQVVSSLMSSWIASCRLIAAKFSESVLLTFKGLRDLPYGVWAGSGILFLAIAQILWACPYQDISDSSFFWGSEWVLGLCSATLAFLSVRITILWLVYLRPSVNVKDPAYELGYKKHLVVLMGGAIGMLSFMPFFLCWGSWPLVSLAAVGLFGGSVIDYHFALMPGAFATTPMFVFCVLFYLESLGSLKDFCGAIGHAVKMVLLNYPVCWVIGVCQFLCGYISLFLGGPLVGALIVQLFLPFWCSLLNVLYLFFLNKDIKRYVPEP